MLMLPKIWPRRSFLRHGDIGKNCKMREDTHNGSQLSHNVCRRWIRNQGRETTRFMPLDDGGNCPTPDLADSLADETDLELELERHELANLLDQAMALLPQETRTVLIE